MVDVRFQESDDEFVCEGCGERVPAFLDSCPYCDGPEEGEDLAPCPSCGVSIYDDAERCPVCAAWIVPPRGTTKQRRYFIAFVAILLVAAVLLAILFNR